MLAQSVSTPRFSKPQEARCYCSASQSQPGTVHTMQRTAAGWVCTCAGYTFTGCCKHLDQVERRAEREGWDFGAVCPLHRAARYFPVDGDTAAAPQIAPAATGVPFRSRTAREERDAELYG